MMYGYKQRNVTYMYTHTCAHVHTSTNWLQIKYHFSRVNCTAGDQVLLCCIDRTQPHPVHSRLMKHITMEILSTKEKKPKSSAHKLDVSSSKLSLSICMSHCSISISQSKHARRKISTQKLVIWINMWPTFVAVQLLPLPFCKEEVRVVQPGCHAYMYHRVYSTYTICGMHGHTHTHTHTHKHTRTSTHSMHVSLHSLWHWITNTCNISITAC